MRLLGWDSSSYDPFVNRDMDVQQLGQFQLITSYEVFEHVPDIHQLMKNLDLLLAQDGLIFFTTLLSDGKIIQDERLTWWYASPRNGHISLFSQKSLAILSAQYQFKFASFNDGTHILFRQIPDWAAHIIRLG